MTANRLTPDGSTPTTGADLMNDIREEFIAGWAQSASALGSVSGTNTIAAAATVTLAAYSEGLAFWLIPANTITGPATINVDFCGAVAIVDKAGAPLVDGDLQAASAYLIVKLGASFRVLAGMPDAASQIEIAGSEIQTFDSNGSWSPIGDFPDDAMVLIEGWGPGGGGGSNAGGGGGGGGGKNSRWMRLGDISYPVTVTVPAGGAVNTAGGTTTFGAYLTAYGGGSGGNNSSGAGGGGGGPEAVGSNGGAGGAGSATGGNGGGPLGGTGSTGAGTDGLAGAGGGVSAGSGAAGGKGIDGGGGGSGGNSSSAAGGASRGGGGGGGGGSAGVGGVSLEAGNGGATGVAGSAPAGGGGRNAAGGAGRVKVTIFAAGVSPQGPVGERGPTGGAIVLPYVFSTTTTDSDPGVGTLRLNQATQNTATVIRADLFDADGNDRTSTLASLDDSTSTVKGYLRLHKLEDPTAFLLFTLASIATPSGYRNITATIADYSAASPFADGDNIVVSFIAKGDKGDTGSTGAAGAGGVQLAYSTTTTDSDPGSGVFRFNSATIASVTAAYIDNNESGGSAISAWLDTFDDSTSTTRGYLVFRGVTVATAFAVFRVTGSVVDGTGYRKLTLTHIASGGVWTNTNTFALAFSQTGDLGATGSTGSTGSAGSAGATGPNVGLDYQWETSTSGDPGNGKVRLNNATPASATSFAIDDLDRNGANQEALIQSVDNSTSTNKARLRVLDVADRSNWVEYLITAAFADQTGYWTAAVTYVGSNGTLADDAVVSVVFFEKGDKGDTGSTGSTGTLPRVRTLEDKR